MSSVGFCPICSHFCPLVQLQKQSLRRYSYMYCPCSCHWQSVIIDVLSFSCVLSPFLTFTYVHGHLNKSKKSTGLRLKVDRCVYFLFNRIQIWTCGPERKQHCQVSFCTIRFSASNVRPAVGKPNRVKHKDTPRLKIIYGSRIQVQNTDRKYR